MIKNEIYNNLTEGQLELLNKVLGEIKLESITDKEINEAITNLLEYKGEENYLNENGMPAELGDDYNEVYRFLMSLFSDEQVRVKHLLEDGFKEMGLPQNIRTDVVTLAHNLGMDYGFTDSQAERMLESAGIDWESVEEQA